MSETYYVGSYWLARAESAKDCAQRAEHFFHNLGRCDPAWTHWYKPADSFENARHRQVSPDAASFQSLFREKEHQIDEGFSFGLWTGDGPEETSSVDTRCGFADQWISSSCVLKPYTRGPIAARVLTARVMAKVLRAMALAWEPEWGVATSDAHRQMAVKGFPHPGTFVGWMTYISRLRGPVPPLPAPVQVEPVEDKGFLITLTSEQFTVSNPEHVALAARVHELLNQSGLLRPLQPWPMQ